MHRIVLVALALTVGGLARAADLKRPARLLVFNFAVHGDAAGDLSRTLADVAAREVSRVGGFQVLAWADISAQLTVEKQRQMVGCSESSSCMAELAGAIDAERTISGAVTRTAEGFVISATFVDARRVTTLGGSEEIVRSQDPQELFDAVRRVVFKILTGRSRETGGSIEFAVEERAARVVLDGTEIGRGPLKKAVRVSEGLHRVTVAKEGYATWESSYRIEAGARAAVIPSLVRLPNAETIRGRAFGWSAVGTATLALVAGGVAIWQESESRSSYAEARRMVGPGGSLAIGADATAYRDAVARGDSSRKIAVATGIGAGVALVGSVALGWVAYRQTGEIGPFRF